MFVRYDNAAVDELARRRQIFQQCRRQNAAACNGAASWSQIAATAV